MSKEPSDAQGPAAAPARPDVCPAAHFNPFVPPYLEKPASFHARLRREAPIAFNPVIGMWLVSRYDDICAILKEPARFSSADIGTASVPSPEALAIFAKGYPQTPVPLNSDPPAHTRMRRLLARGFTASRIAALEPRIRQIANELIDAFVADGHADLVTQFSYPLPLLVILHMVGVPPEDMVQVKRWCSDWFTFVFTPVPPERQAPLAQSMVDYQHYLAKLIEQRRQEPREDLTSDLVSLEPDGESLSMAELVTNIGGSLVAAGHETTLVAISKCVQHLLSEPSRWRALKEDPSLIPLAIEESLRFDSTTHGMVRTATEDVTVGGVSLPRGARLFLLYASANRDESHFPDPDRFDPHRAHLSQHLAFGHGIHYCMGAPLARLEVRIALELLLKRLPDLRLAPGQQIEHTLNLAIHGLKALRLEWTPPQAP